MPTMAEIDAADSVLVLHGHVTGANGIHPRMLAAMILKAAERARAARTNDRKLLAAAIAQEQADAEFAAEDAREATALSERGITVFILRAIESLLSDPAPDQFRRGYLCALIDAYNASWRRTPKVRAAERLIKSTRSGKSR